MNIHRILAATDMSMCATHAETRAAMLCHALQVSEIALMTVIDFSLPGALERLLNNAQAFSEASLAEHAERDLQRIASRLQSEYNVVCNCSVEFGRPASRIASKADEISADLVVAGEHGCNSVSDAFLGNTPYKLLHVGRHPLLIVKNQPERAYESILVPVDFSDNSMLAAQTALAISPTASVTLLHGFEALHEGLMNYAGVSRDFIRGYRTEAKDNAMKEMDRFLSDLDKGGRPVASSVQFGYPPLVIQEHAETFKPDLIVIGKHGKSRLEDFLLGSVTRHTIEETYCDILVTLPPKASTLPSF